MKIPTCRMVKHPLKFQYIFFSNNLNSYFLHTFNLFFKDDELSRKRQKTSPALSENFNYRLALIWFLAGTVAGFLSFQLLKCISNRSKVKKKSEANSKVNHEIFSCNLDESKIM